MPNPVTLTFPAGFDPMAASNTEVAETVRRLWLDAANAAFQEEFAKLRGDDELPDTLPLTEEDLTLFLDPDTTKENPPC